MLFLTRLLVVPISSLSEVARAAKPNPDTIPMPAPHIAALNAVESSGGAADSLNHHITNSEPTG